MNLQQTQADLSLINRTGHPVLMVQLSFYMASRLLSLGQQDNGERHALFGFPGVQRSQEKRGNAKLVLPGRTSPVRALTGATHPRSGGP